MTSNTPVSDQLFDRARSLMPGGVNSPVRAFGSVGGTPKFMVSAKGPYLTDADGREYVDLVCSWGPALLGHAHPAVLDAVHAAVDRGLSFGASTPDEANLAAIVKERVSAVERIRMVSTGTEATMTAVRLARGFTGRNLIVKFAGCYHGHLDGLLAAAGSGLATMALPGSAGVTEAAAAETLVLPYNDLGAVEAAFAAHGNNIAAVITEAAPANMGVVTPNEGFNAGLSRITREHGALLILDEVLTGFRTGYAGYWGLTGRQEGWTPDLLTFGKVIGGGMPTAALGGRADVMDYLAPLGPVYQAGTLSGNPVAMAAGVATLTLATPGGLQLRGCPLAGTLGGTLIGAGHRRRGPLDPARREPLLRGLRYVGQRRPQLRRRPGPRGLPLRTVLPLHAGLRCLPAAVGLRGVVPVRCPRRRRDEPDLRRAPCSSQGGRGGHCLSTALFRCFAACSLHAPPGREQAVGNDRIDKAMIHLLKPSRISLLILFALMAGAFAGIAHADTADRGFPAVGDPPPTPGTPQAAPTPRFSNSPSAGSPSASATPAGPTELPPPPRTRRRNSGSRA